MIIMRNPPGIGIYRAGRVAVRWLKSIQPGLALFLTGGCFSAAALAAATSAGPAAALTAAAARDPRIGRQ